MMNLDQHKVYVDSLKMEMVPLSVVKQLLEDLREEYEKKYESSMSEIETTLNNIQKSIQDND